MSIDPALAALGNLTFTRVFNAPRALVWKVWTDPYHVAQWWGPGGFTNPVCKWDARAGGTIHVDMTGPDGVVYPMGGVFEELDEPHRLVFISTAMPDANGEPGLAVRNVVTFEEHDGKTTMTLRTSLVSIRPDAEAALGGMHEGWSQSLDKLAIHITTL